MLIFYTLKPKLLQQNSLKSAFLSRIALFPIHHLLFSYILFVKIKKGKKYAVTERLFVTKKIKKGDLLVANLLFIKCVFIKILHSLEFVGMV